MRRIELGILAAVAMISAAGGASAETWRTYVNPRFGVSAQVPASWKMEAPPENGDGEEFTAPGGRAQITVSGILSTSPRDQEFSIRTQPHEGETITYEIVRGNIALVSGVHGDKIFYRKSILNCNAWSELSIEYPAREKAQFDGLVVHVAASLKAGRGYGSPDCS